jgi:hypothetical protein
MPRGKLLRRAKKPYPARVEDSDESSLRQCGNPWKAGQRPPRHADLGGEYRQDATSTIPPYECLGQRLGGIQTRYRSIGVATLLAIRSMARPCNESFGPNSSLGLVPATADTPCVASPYGLTCVEYRLFKNALNGDPDCADHIGHTFARNHPDGNTVAKAISHLRGETG